MIIGLKDSVGMLNEGDNVNDDGNTIRFCDDYNKDGEFYEISKGDNSLFPMWIWDYVA